MLVHFGIENIRADWKSSTVVVGTFDGVHLGHRALIQKTIQEATEREQPSVIVTFDRHPATILSPDHVPLQIGTLEQNVIQMRQAGASVCVILPFDAGLSRTTAHEFFDEILVGSLRANQVVVGHDFGFGMNREGNADWLRSRVDTVEFPPFAVNGQRVSSSLIRCMVDAGQVEEVQQYLGRPFSIAGVVVSGHKRGRALGFPTLNIARSTQGLLPADGVYAGVCRVKTVPYKAAISIGTNETFGEGPRTIEAYLLDYPGTEIYGCPVELGFIEKIRGQQRFESVQELIDQMNHDVQQASTIALG
ncbi:MAG: bifunctional riboflavin kinase/FAD synthetase [Armatimonadetes bacterium]|nr:bifunctional riboflavin kinase/FAD synthetase [Armatimonadota bacterium]